MKELIINNIYKIEQWGINVKKPFLYFVSGFIVFFISGIFHFYFLKLFPSENSFYIHLSTIITLVLIIAFIFPLREKLDSYFSKKILSEYYMDEYSDLQIANKKFEFKILINRVFPDMVRISGANKGRLIIYSKNKNYEIYAFKENGPKKIKSRSINLDPNLYYYLKDKKNPITISNTEGLNWLNESFNSLKANFILPFTYREKLFGFLSLDSIPSQSSIINLKMLASKSALSIYNNILSTQVADLHLYKREIENANRIQGMVFNTRVPKSGKIEYKLEKKLKEIILEFIPMEKSGEYLIVSIALAKNNLGSGLVLAHILGKLYIFSVIKKSLSHKIIKQFVEEILDDLNWKDGYDMVVGILSEQEEKIIFSQTGTQFKITNGKDNNPLISVGWRYTLDLNETQVYLNYKSNKILAIKKF